MKKSILFIFLYLAFSQSAFAEDWNIIHTNEDDYYHFIDGIDSLNYVVSGYYSNNDPNDLKRCTFIKKNQR